MKMAASCQTNMSPKHYIKRLQTRKQLWKPVRTSFQKRLLQPFKSSSGLSVHASSYYVWLFISSLTFHAVIFNISLSLVAVCTDFEFDKFRDTAPSIKYSQFHFSSLQLDRILYNLLAMFSTDILGICIPLRKLKRKEKESHEQSDNLIVLLAPYKGIQVSAEFWIPNPKLWNMDSLSVDPGFWIPIRR